MWPAMTCGLVAALAAACAGEPKTLDDPGPPPAVEPGESRLARLTRAQYEASVHDLLGAAIVVPANLEPDTAVDGLLAIGATRTSISPLGVERFETAAYEIARQAMEPGPGRDALVPCAPAGVVDDGCARATLAALGRRAWRRPLDAAELDRLVAVSSQAATALGDFHDGLEFGVAGLLQSPHFLFRVELGEPDPAAPGRLRYGDYEMASRLSYFLWNTTPDDELLAAAERGELVTDDGVRAQVERLLASPRARAAVRSFFADLWQLYELDAMVKDPTLFTHMSAEVGPAAREETLLLVEHVLFDGSADYRDLFTTRTTFVNRKLASIYGIRAPVREGFGWTVWPEDAPRRGVLTHISFLAGQAHEVSSSATLRGKFVRGAVLCGKLLPPPTDVNTAIPEPDAESPTLRDRIAVHLENTFCAGCHLAMDPIGLGFENFDAIGRFRERENDAIIDASGELDGVAFADAVELAQVVREHPDLASCLVSNAFRYATGRDVADGERDLIDWHTRGFDLRDHSVVELWRAIASGPGFRTAAPAATEAQ